MGMISHTGVVTLAETRAQLPKILERARLTRQHFVIVKRGQEQGVILGLDEYRRLKELDEREQRRERALAIPIEAARSTEAWQASFETLERIREKAAYLTDDEMDTLATEALAHVRDATPEIGQ
ncbi:MAG: type II toxin-antitoxin system Phd/YefM family antitoxin [Chloroflexi bacterium]|nr:type II toxin-antitoxin system Phd/YefM family antitoxin [Chloroflexota bacterium]